MKVSNSRLIQLRPMGLAVTFVVHAPHPTAQSKESVRLPEIRWDEFSVSEFARGLMAVKNETEQVTGGDEADCCEGEATSSGVPRAVLQADEFEQV